MTGAKDFLNETGASLTVKAFCKDTHREREITYIEWNGKCATKYQILGHFVSRDMNKSSKRRYISEHYTKARPTCECVKGIPIVRAQHPPLM